MSTIDWNPNTNQWEYKIGTVWVPIIELDPIAGKALNDIGPYATDEQFAILNTQTFIEAVDKRFAEMPAFTKLSDEDEGQPVVPFKPGEAPSEQPPEEEPQEVPPPTRHRPAVWPPLDKNDKVDISRVLQYYAAYGNPTDPKEAEVNAGRIYATQEEAEAELPEGFHSDSFKNSKGQTFWTHIKDKEFQNRPNVFETLKEAKSFLQPGFTIISTSDGNYTFKEIPPLEERAANTNTMMAELIRDGDIKGALQLDELLDFIDKPRDEGGNDGKLSFDEAFSFASGLAKTTAEFERLFTLATGIDANEVTPFEPFTFPSGFNIADMLDGQSQSTEQPVGGFNQFGDVPPSLPGFPQFAHEKPPLIGFGDELPDQVPLGSPFADIADTETEAAATANNATVSSGPPVIDLSGVSQEDINHYFPSDDAWREEQAGKKAAKGKNPFVLAASNAFELTMTARQQEARNKRGSFQVTHR